MKIAFGTVIYQEAFEYAYEFIESLNRQTIGFDLVVINDNCTQEQVEDLVSKSRHKVVVENSKGGMSPAELRIELILYAKRLHYDLLISGDFDDKFMENRVETIVQHYAEKYAFFYNELYDFENNNIMRKLPEVTSDIRDIADYNYLGLSNSAFNLKRISLDLLESMRKDYTRVFDWYLFSRILLQHESGKMVKDTGTYYRIHDHNIAGITYSNIHPETIKKEIQVKIDHYILLNKYSEIFSDKLEFYLDLKKKSEQELADLKVDCNNEYWWGLLVNPC